ncbi:glycosyltransferase family 2 protein [Candidatus Nitrosotenuis uzonensis]|uniref:Hyaluronan synthase n=1 Tax=Candidatus Nitrosotenuis uzonensis TaxID=1407055 RepID=V6ASN2_9ARCH|nr:glycosyltransferase family 2 protein [Candidatus Nitrosotenuis uzonensis]CDI05458.1 putative Hyaluronan synthase [Candidatus Nitrosotenuis uzonensis]
MDAENILKIVEHLQKARIGDVGRLSYIEKTIKSGKNLYNSDIRYVLAKSEQLKTQLSVPKIPANAPKQAPPHRCYVCNDELHLQDRVVRHQNEWMHLACFDRKLKTMPELQAGNTAPEQQAQEKSTLVPEPSQSSKSPIARQQHKHSKEKAKTDPVLVLLAIVIFSLLIFTAYSMFSTLSIIAISLAAILVFFQIVSKTSPQVQYKYGRKGASLFSISVMIMPFGLGTIIAYDGYSSGAMSIIQTVFIWGLTLSFWQTMLFVPLAIRSIARESLLQAPTEYPRMSVLIPAYNEEKVIRTTIESLIATDYPDKEIIAIDDGSKDQTFSIMSEYKDKIKVIHKENGGKASALNAGMLYATGSIIVILDADTIIGYSSLKQLAKSFSNENVAAVAGNIKIRNRVNILTWCQALEYLSGIQIMRRGLDYFGAITIVPGALGAFKKDKLEEAGAYHKETLVEDFDATMKVLRSGMIVSGSNMATAYTQGPNTLIDFYKQRKRWYRGNLQVLRRHSDILLNPRFGYLQKFAYPLMAIHMLLIPSASLLVLGFAVYQIILGNYLYIAYTLGLYIILQHLLSAMAVRMDKDDKRLILYSTLMVIGYKQLTDILQLKAVIEEVFKLKAKWTSAKRVQQ